MKIRIQFIVLLIIFFGAFCGPAAANYYDRNGVNLDKDRYEKVIQMRSPEIEQINKNGYPESSSRLEDPVRLRNRRIEQWKEEAQKSRRK